MPKSLRSKGLAPTSFFSFQDIITCISGILILITLLLSTQVNPSQDADTRQKNKSTENQEGDLSATLDQLAGVKRAIQTIQQAQANARALPGVSELQRDLATIQTLHRDKVAELDREKQERLAEQKAAEEKDRQWAATATNLNARLEDVEKALRNAKAKLAEMTRKRDEILAKLHEAQADDEAMQKNKNKIWLIPDASGNAKKALVAVVSGREVSLQQFNKSEEAKKLSTPVTEGDFRQLLQPYPASDYYTVFYIKPSGIEVFKKISKAARAAGYDIGYDALDESAELTLFKE